MPDSTSKVQTPPTLQDRALGLGRSSLVLGDEDVPQRANVSEHHTPYPAGAVEIDASVRRVNPDRTISGKRRVPENEQTDRFRLLASGRL